MAGVADLPHVSVQPGLVDELNRIRESLQGLATLAEENHPVEETVYRVASRAEGPDLDLPTLRAVIVPWAGLPKALAEALTERPHLAVYNLHHNAAATAEMAVGLLIASARRIVEADRSLRKGEWLRRMDDRQGVLLEGKRAIVLGMGAVGTRVASLLRALGMDVVGVRRQPAGEDVGVGDLDAILPAANALVVCVPLTSETHSLIDARRIALLQPPRLLVNVGRGPVVDERALYEACRDGVLFGAGIDTWYQYPQPEERAPVWPSALPFHQLENVVMSPHHGGDGDDAERMRADALIALLTDLLQCRSVRAVDARRGY